MTQRKLPLCIFLSLSLFLASCGVPRIYRPQVPEMIDPNTTAVKYTTTAYGEDFKAYEAALDEDPPKLAVAQRLRDRMINRIREQIEFYYREYELKLASGRALFETGADVAGLGLSTASSVGGGAALKSILSAALSGVQGTRLSISKNYLREKTTELIISAMRGSRQEKLNQIIEKMKIPVDKFTFEEARADLVEFFYAGTLQGALQTLAADSGKKDADAKLDEKENTQERIEKINAASEAEETDSKAVRDMFRALKKNNDDTEAQAAIAELKQRGITITVPAAAKAKEIYEAIDKEIEKLLMSPNRETLLPKYKEAFEQLEKNKKKPIVEEGSPDLSELQTTDATSAGALR